MTTGAAPASTAPVSLLPQFNTASHQVWIQFDGVNASAHVVLNGSPVCNHDGGYSTFRANITELLRDENELTVEVDNSKNDRVYPQKADFTFYGGIYRDVSLMVVSKNHFTLDYFGGPGIRITPHCAGRRCQRSGYHLARRRR